MKYLSVCSGIEAATVAWHHMGWQPVGFSEIEPFPSAVLAHQYPNVPNLGDMTKYKEWNIEHPDILVGGTPCQSFSVAGLRKGMEDPRGNLALVYCGLLDHFRPRWFVWENVPGVLSSSGGRDFGAFLGALAELGYGFAYRVLDAQFFGVAQRRRRVFVVGYLGDWRPPAAVLFERQSLRRDTPPSREARKDTSTSIGAGLIGGIDYENNAHGSHDPTGPLLKGSPSGGGRPLPAIITMAHGQGGAEIAVNRTPTLTCIHEAPIAAYALQGNMIGRSDTAGPQGSGISEEISFTMTKADIHGVAQPIVLEDQGGSAINVSQNDIVGTLRRETHGHEPCVIHGTQDPCVSNIAFAHGRNNGGENVVTQPINIYGGNKRKDRPNGGFYVEDAQTSKTLDAASGLNPTCSQGGTAVMQLMAVRRLTPVERERLQGFPDGYTNIPWRKQPESPDGPRYKALGNSMAVPVMRWIGNNIRMVDDFVM